jgi:RNA polymerase sigma factor (sigma-70 family)
LHAKKYFFDARKTHLRHLIGSIQTTMDILSTDTEQEILRQFKRDYNSAMDVLYAEYAGYLAAVCARYIANDDDLKDILQESLIKIYSQIGSFQYRGKGSLKAWMSRIVVNESLQALRRDRKHAVFVDTEPPDMPEEEPDTDGLNAEEITEMIRSLPEGYRVVFNLYVVEGKSHKEIARMLGIKPDTSASQLHRAKNLLARLITEHKRSKQ